jgi:hypothetical protein
MFDWLTFGRDQILRVALVITMVAGATAAAFGIGYRSSDAVLGDGSAYVQKGHTVAHVNAASERTDAEAARDLATGRQRLEVVQVGPGNVYVVNNATGEVWRMPTDTLLPQPVQAPPAPEKNQLITGGDTAYLYNSQTGTLAHLDGQRADPVALPVRADAVVVDSHGTAWALSKVDGVLYQIVNGTVHSTQTVAIPGEAMRLTLASDRPVVLLPERGNGGVVRVIGQGADHPEMVVDKQPDAALEVSQPGSEAGVIAMISQRDDTVVTVDLKTGEEQRLKLEGRGGPRAYGSPVVAHGYIYVPDFTRRQVVILQLKPLRQIRSVTVPGRESTFEVFEREDRVWVNDPYSRTLLAFNGDQWTEPDKGPGRGVDDAPQPSQTPSTPPSPPKSDGPDRPDTSASRRPAPGPKPSPSPPPRIAVPDVAGLTGAEACNRVTEAGLRCLPPITKQQPGCETGKALSSVPAAGSLEPPRTQVTVFVCGPAAVPGPLTGMPIDQACRTVEAAGLVCARQDAGAAPTPAQVGTVSAQNPAAGTQVANGSTVDVGYFTTVGVPAIVGMDPATACATLQAQGLACAPNADEITWQANVVHSQSVAPGTPVALGTAIGYVYEDAFPVQLQRWKLNGEDARFLSTGEGPTGAGSWTGQTPVGGVYGLGGGVPGLVTVNRFHCTTSCGGGRRNNAYYYSQSATPPTSAYPSEGPAFTCFGGQQAGTQPLYAMFHPTKSAWAFAPAGSGEYQTYANEGYGVSFTICYVWWGVPGFP